MNHVLTLALCRRNLSVVVHRRHFHIRIVHQINARAGLQIIMYGMFPDLCPDSFQYVIDRRTIFVGDTHSEHIAAKASVCASAVGCHDLADGSRHKMDQPVSLFGAVEGIDNPETVNVKMDKSKIRSRALV